MVYIPNTEYITINENGFFIGNKEVVGYYEETEDKKLTLFHGHEMYATQSFVAGFVRFGDWFKSIQSRIPDIEEIHAGAFDTTGERNKQGFPSGKIGANLWCRIKLKGKDATYNPWVFRKTSYAVGSCVSTAGLYCVKQLANEPDFASAVLQAANTDSKKIEQPQKTNLSENDTSITDLKQRLQNMDLSKLTGKTVELNGYKIMIRKIAQNAKTTNKR